MKKLMMSCSECSDICTKYAKVILVRDQYTIILLDGLTNNKNFSFIFCIYDVYGFDLQMNVSLAGNTLPVFYFNA